MNEEKVMGENPEEDKSPHKNKIWKSNGLQTTKTKLAMVRLAKERNTSSTDRHSREKSRKCKFFSVKQSWMKYTRLLCEDKNQEMR